MNQFLKAALEEISPSDLNAENPSLAVATLPSEGSDETSQKLLIEQERNQQLQLELDDQRDAAATQKTGEFVDALNGAVVAVESLIALGNALGSAIQSGDHSMHGNVGFAVALESITGSIGIRDALEDAESESRALILHELKDEKNPEVAEEKAKTGGIFETVKKKVQQAWEFVLKISRRVVDFIMSGVELVKMMREKVQMPDEEALNTMFASKFDGKITNPDFIKLTGLGKNDQLIGAANQTFIVLDRIKQLLDVYPGFVKSVIGAANEIGNNEAQRPVVIEAANKIGSVLTNVFAVNGGNSSLPQDLQKMISNREAKIIASPKLLGGNYIWLEIQEIPDKLPKMSIHLERERVSELPSEVPTIPEAVLRTAKPVLEDLMARGEKRWQEIAMISKNLKTQAPSNFQNMNNVDDAIAFTTGSVGLMGSLTAQMANLIQRYLVLRTFRIFSHWIAESVKVYKDPKDKDDKMKGDAGGAAAAPAGDAGAKDAADKL